MAADPQARRPRPCPGWDAEDHPQSVKTGRTNDDVKADRDALWNGEAPAAAAEIDLTGAVEAPMPANIEPMLATLATKPFSDPDWLYEIKWDGFRVQAVIADRKVKIWTRNLKDAATYFPRLLTPPTWIDASQAIVDGEVVALDDAGRPDFSLLQERLGDATARRASSTRRSTCSISTGGRCSTSRSRTASDSSRACSGRIRASASRPTSSGRAWRSTRRRKAQRLEGIIAKLRRSRYEPGRRTSAWLKLKIRPEQELVVGGWTPGEGNARDLGAVVVGVYEDEAPAVRRQGRLRVRRPDAAS